MEPPDILINAKEGVGIIDGKPRRFTRAQLKIFEAIYKTYPRVASRDFIMDHVYGLFNDRDDPSEKIIDVQLVKMRKQLIGTNWRIDTIWGAGYRLVHDVEQLELDVNGTENKRPRQETFRSLRR